MPTTHIFVVNGAEFRWSSEHVAGTGMGCTEHVRTGRVQPNEHGTWYTGRNGWCNGADVPVHVFDVTAAVVGKAVGRASAVNVTYRAMGPGACRPASSTAGIV